MKNSNVHIGVTYQVKVANNLVPVTITREHENGGWEGVSVNTGKTIRIKDADRLQTRVETTDMSAKPTTDTNSAAEPNTGEHVAKGGDRDDGSKPMSLICAAAAVLKVDDRPLSCKEIVAKAIESNLWKPGHGKTPANTLYAAITREIADKGDSSRFIKIERGRFIFNPHAT